MKQVLNRCLWLAFFVGLTAGCGSVETADFVDYQADVGGIHLTLSYPENWVIAATPDTIVLATDDALLNAETVTSGSSMLISTLPSSALITTDLTPLVQSQLNALWEQEGLQAREEAAQTTINGKEAITAVLDSRTDEAVFHFTIINGENNIALIFAQTAAADEEALVPVVEQVINSIQIESVLQ